MAPHVSPHDRGDNRSVLMVWHSGQDVIGWWLSGKGKSSEGVHDQVDPKHLNSIKWGVFDNA